MTVPCYAVIFLLWLVCLMDPVSRDPEIFVSKGLIGNRGNNGNLGLRNKRLNKYE